MSPLERLLQEAIPTRPAQPTYGPWTDTEQDTHWHDLCHAVGTPGAQRPNHPPDTNQTAA